jgi:integrase
VPIPPVLVMSLQTWLERNDLTAPDSLLFRTRNGTRPNGANWNRAWKRALATVGHRSLRVYDCRHAAATTWLRAGVPLGETARRMGHSVETLVSTYVGALEGDEHISNKRIERALGE